MGMPQRRGGIFFFFFLNLGKHFGKPNNLGSREANIVGKWTNHYDRSPNTTKQNIEHANKNRRNQTVPKLEIAKAGSGGDVNGDGENVNLNNFTRNTTRGTTADASDCGLSTRNLQASIANPRLSRADTGSDEHETAIHHTCNTKNEEAPISHMYITLGGLPNKTSTR